MRKMSKTSNGVISGLIDFLSETGQKGVLPEVTNELQNLIRGAKEADKITITSCVRLDPAQINNLKKIIKNYTGSNLPVVNKLDKKLLGGFTVRIGDFFLDTSLSRQLQNLKRELI